MPTTRDMKKSKRHSCPWGAHIVVGLTGIYAHIPLGWCKETLGLEGLG